MKKIANIAKSALVYLCSLIIAMGLSALVFSSLAPNFGTLIYLPVVIVGLALGFFAEKKINSVLGIVVLVILAVVSFIVGDMVMHSLNGRQHGLHRTAVLLPKT